MNWLDGFIVIWLVLSSVRGFSIGLLRQGLSFGGFLLGLFIGGWLAPHVSQLSEGGASRVLITIMITLGLAVVMSALGDRLAGRLQASLKLKPAHHLNSFLGGFASAFFVLVSSWLIASALTRLPFAQAGLVIDQSKIVQAMNQVMPPAPRVMERLGRLISPHGFPEVFVGQEPTIDPAGPPNTPEVEAAAAKAKGSMARIEGYACGGISVGSGYVAAPNYVATNAHVVAGVRRPVISIQGKRYPSQVVLFNPKLDFAVLRTDAILPGKPLELTKELVPSGTSAAVLGFPGGGGLRISPGVVSRSQVALGRDIYNRGIVSREIYALHANVEPGNSGGPVVLADGSVAGVIFGESLSNDGAAYALTSKAVADDIGAVVRRTNPVSTGPCL